MIEVDYSKINGAEYFLWGTYGYNGDQPLKYVPFKELCSDHIQAILETQMHIYQKGAEQILNALRAILLARGERCPMAFDLDKYNQWIERLRLNKAS